MKKLVFSASLVLSLGLASCGEDTIKEDEHPFIHSDRGYQYTSIFFKQMIDDAGMIHSMSRVGRCIDNEPIEAFWVRSNTKNTI